MLTSCCASAPPSSLQRRQRIRFFLTIARCWRANTSSASARPRTACRELPTAVYDLAQCVVVDSDAARHEVGDLIKPLAAGVLREDSVYHLAELVTGVRRVDVTSTTVCKSVGMALYDLYAASALVTEAQ